ncbi:hypothetical protein [Clostridium sp. AF22-10]|jgi:hypothetical protein|uniref:hypothetical protein n=1 Tax=Clostridium sp. AF22-10 TaxID=2293004 RepID=UPI000E47A171|nr:hypothetical protein DWX91_15205 [Clostridium sp. AF22-10]
MKEVKHYICEICGIEYHDKQKCQECEKNHKQIKKIISTKYQSLSMNVKGYPVSITVEMDDGKELTFKR